MTLALTPNLEDYLEAIFHIVTFNKVARSMEIADRMKVKRSSVTLALRSLSEKGLIHYQARSYVTLTDKGLSAARCIDRRHHILHDMFTKVLQLPEEAADKAACAMEHGMSEEVCRKMTAFLMAMNAEGASAEKIIACQEKLARTINCHADCGYKPLRSDRQKGHDATSTLNDLVTGESAVVVRVSGEGMLRRRLQEMGITRGETITMVRAAPLDDPIEVKVKSSRLSLRREEAVRIDVKHL